MSAKRQKMIPASEIDQYPTRKKLQEENEITDLWNKICMNLKQDGVPLQVSLITPGYVMTTYSAKVCCDVAMMVRCEGYDVQTNKNEMLITKKTTIAKNATPEKNANDPPPYASK